MSTLELVVRILSGLGLLAANGMFVTTEFALTRLRQFDEEEMDEHSSLKLGWEMTGQLEIYLTACQVGITVTSILLGVVFEPGVTHVILPAMELIGLSESNTMFVSITLSVVLIQLMHTVWGEQSPTYLGVERPKQVVRIFAPILYGWTWLSYPLIWVGDHLAKATLGIFGISLERSWTKEDTIESKAELRKEMGELLSKGELSEERRNEIINALEIDELPTRSIMVPRDNIRFISTGGSVEEMINLLSEHQHSRFPLVADDLDDYRGTIYVPSVMTAIDQLRNGQIDWEDIAVETMSVSPGLPVSKLVDKFQAEHQELALVVEEKHVVGLVTSTDAFEAVLGELKDPFD